VNKRRVLLDENLPVRLRLWLPPDIEAVTVAFMGWKGVRNGELVRRARAEGFTALITADRPLAMAPRAWAPMGCIHVASNDLARLQAAAERLGAACQTILPGQVVHVHV
jgi:hypothetical protein